MHASVNVGCQGKSGPGKIHEVILVKKFNCKPVLQSTNLENIDMKILLLLMGTLQICRK